MYVVIIYNTVKPLITGPLGGQGEGKWRDMVN